MSSNGAYYNINNNNNDDNNSTNPEIIDNIHAALARYLLLTKEITNVGAYLKQTSITNADRVNYLNKYLEQFNLFPKIKKNIQKNNNLSCQYREQGNEAFRIKKLNAALELYNKCIAFAETSNSTETLALGYANRSAVLFELHYFTECIADIKHALLHNYPTAKLDKLKVRLMKAEKLLKNSRKHQFHLELNEKIEHPNDIIPCASNKIKVDFHPDLGRYVVATEYIQPGEIIAIENPYIAILLRNYFHQNCHYCFKHILNPIPCDSCPYAMFCNDQCKRNALLKHHKYECELLPNIIDSKLTKMAQLSLRIAIIAKDEYDYIDKTLLNKTCLDKMGLTLDNGKFVLKSNYTGIHHLITNTEHFPVNEIFHKTIVAAVLLNLLKQIDFFDCERHIYIASELLLRHLQTAPSNFHQISAIKAITDNYAESEAFADGAYPFLSMFNHSCAPNTFRTTYCTTKVVRALRPIQAGQQLFDSYGAHHALTSRTERIKNLHEQYFFTCNCEACVNNWPTWHELELKRTRMPEMQFLEELIHQVSRRDITEATKQLPRMIKMLNKLEQLAPCAQLCELQETFKEIFSLKGNVYNILQPPK